MQNPPTPTKIEWSVPYALLGHFRLLQSSLSFPSKYLNENIWMIQTLITTNILCSIFLLREKPLFVQAFVAVRLLHRTTCTSQLAHAKFLIINRKIKRNMACEIKLFYSCGFCYKLNAFTPCIHAIIFICNLLTVIYL